MSITTLLRARLLGLLGWGLALTLAQGTPAHAESGEDGELATLQGEIRENFSGKVVPFLNTYCVDCHGAKKRKGQVNFQPALKNPVNAAFGKQWKQSLANVKAHDMPPDEAEKQPSDAERQMFTDWVGKLKYLSPKDPGTFVIRRLTRTEYGNTLHDLFGVDPAIGRDLPEEVFGAGYLNTLSPLQMEQYLGIANQVVDQVIAPEGTPPSEVQRRWFGPAPGPGPEAARAAAQEVARRLTRAAYRRPASAAELEVLLRVFDLAQENQLSEQASLSLLLKAVLVSPQFLFITPAAEAAPDREIVPLDDYQLASRLSYLLWATLPDAELAALADASTLHEPAVLSAQVQRLLASPRARALFDGFGAQWLGLGALETKTFDTAKFPEMTGELRQAMYEEARLFFDSILRENRSVATFIDGDYTFLNEPLAKLYGLDKAVTGPEMRRVSLTDRNRGGILGMPGILATTSFPNRTSPVKRGVWVLEQLLGENVPPAPPNVPALEKQDQKSVADLTLRQRTELHRSNAVCANCHQILDPIGFGLENFDAIGRWRDRDDTGGAIDAAGELPGGKHFQSPGELKALLAGRTPDLTRNLTEKLLAYALCRQLEGYDQIVVDQLVDGLAKGGDRLPALVTAVVTSYPFTHCRIPDQLTAAAATPIATTPPPASAPHEK